MCKKVNLITQSQNLKNSTRISALAGDARKALDVLRGAVELAGREQASKITIMHVNNVLNKTYTDRSTEDVPLQQQLIIISLILLAREVLIINNIQSLNVFIGETAKYDGHIAEKIQNSFRES